MKKSQRIKLLFIFLGLFLLGTGFVFALEINYPKVPGAVPPQEFLQSASTSPEQIPSLYIKYIFNLFFWISGIIILGVLIWAGIRYLTSAGKVETIINARQQITSAFLGILILLSSFIILNILNPQLIILKLPKIEPVKVIGRTEVPLPAITTGMTRTAIDTELPLGKILEDYLFTKKRMADIKNNASTTLDIAETLKEQIEDLNDTVDDCDCGEADPDCDSSCNSYCTQDCTCDVCEEERDEIEDIEEKNLEKIDELKEQQNISIEELKKIKIELTKLERLERFMKECPVWRVGSLPQFLYDKDFYIAQNWTLRDVQFWEKIIIGEDWVTLYCPVSGTILGETPVISAESIISELPSVEPPSAEQQMACTTKIPVGEIIDRAKRIANRLIDRLETLIDLDRQMIQAVDEMHVLVSKCSSQQPMCCALCIKIKSVCVIERCIGRACYFSKIDDKADEISEIQAKIEEVVNAGNEQDQKGKEGFGDFGEEGFGGGGGMGGIGGGLPTEETTTDANQNLGIIALIDNVIPKLLEDLDKIIRKPLKECVTDIPTESAVESTEVQVILTDCESSVRTVGPDGVVIQKCCLDESGFQNCLQQCYTKSGQDYQTCLNDCLKGASNEEISICNHQLNFYCCGL